jgi:hypothetical protein
MGIHAPGHGPFEIVDDARADVAIDIKQFDRYARLKTSGVEHTPVAEVDMRGSATARWFWPEVKSDWGRWGEVFPAWSTWAAPSKPVTLQVGQTAAESAYALARDSVEAWKDAALLRKVTSMSTPGPMPGGWPALIVRGADIDDQIPLAFPAGGPVVAQHRGLRQTQFSSFIFDISGLSLAYAAPWHSMVRTQPVTDIQTGAAWWLGVHPSDDSGSGLVVSLGLRGENESVVVGSPPPMVVGHAAWQRGGPFHPGPAADRHRTGTTPDGLPIQPVHLSLASYWCGLDGAYDGPLDHEGPNWRDGADYGVPKRVHFAFDSGRQVNGWWTTDLFYPPTTPGTPTTTTPPTRKTPPPIDIPPPDDPHRSTTGQPGKPGGPGKPGDPGDGRVGDPEPQRQKTGGPTFGFESPNGGRKDFDQGGGRSDGKGKDKKTEFDDALDKLDRDNRKQDKPKKPKPDDQDKPGDDADLSQKDRDRAQQLDKKIEQLREDYQNGRVSLDDFLNLFQLYNRERKRIRRKGKGGGVLTPNQRLEKLKLDLATGVITPQQYLDEIRKINSENRPAAPGPAPDKKPRQKGNQFQPAVSTTAASFPGLFLQAVSPGVPDSGRFGEQYGAIQQQPIGAGVSAIGVNAGGRWTYTTGAGAVFGSPTVESTIYIHPPEIDPRWLDAVESGAYGAANLALHPSGFLGFGLPSATGAIVDGHQFSQSGAAGARQLELNAYDDDGAAAAGNVFRVNTGLTAAGRWNLGDETSVASVAGILDLSAKPGNLFTISNTATINSIIGLAVGDVIRVRPESGITATFAHNAGGAPVPILNSDGTNTVLNQVYQQYEYRMTVDGVLGVPCC